MFNSNKNEGDSCELSPSEVYRFAERSSDNSEQVYHDICPVSRTDFQHLDNRRGHAVQLRYIGRSYIVGKVVYLRSGLPVFHCRLKQTDVLQNMDAFSVAPPVLHHLEQLGGEEVHLHAPWEKALYVATIKTICAKGVLASMHIDIGARYHLPRTYWTKKGLTYRVPYFNKVVTIEGFKQPVRSYPEPVQLGLFEGGVS